MIGARNVHGYFFSTSWNLYQIHNIFLTCVCSPSGFDLVLNAMLSLKICNIPNGITNPHFGSQTNHIISVFFETTCICLFVFSMGQIIKRCVTLTANNIEWIKLFSKPDYFLAHSEMYKKPTLL